MRWILTARLTGRSQTISRREQQDTGFWDNILARGINGRVELAYGHHRLVALKRVMALTDMVDIPVKTFDDATMIKIMANENMEEWKLGPRVINETVKVAKRFLEEHPEEVHLRPGRRPDQGIGVDTIAEFLGWNRTRISNALERLHLIDEGVLDKEAVESMPTDNAARELVDGDYKRICVSMGMERKVEGSYAIATPVSPRCPSPIPVEPEIGVLICMESTGPGLLGIVRRIEIGDQGLG